MRPSPHDVQVWLVWDGPELVAICLEEEAAQAAHEERYVAAADNRLDLVRIEQRWTSS